MASLTALTKRHLKAVRRIKGVSSPINGDGYTVGEGWVEGWISLPEIDRDGELVPVNEWQLDDHAKNPIALINHEKTGPAVGRWQHPDGRYSIEKRADGLWGRCYFNLDTTAGREEYSSYKGGFKRGFSPGFISDRPQQHVVNGRRCNVLRNAKLFEVSLVNIPSGANALAMVCKSSGNHPIPTGKVLRFGAFSMAADTTPETTVEKAKSAPEPKKGVLGFYDTMVSGLTDVFANAKACLDGVTDAERAEALSLAGDAYVCAKSLIAAGKAKFKSAPWDVVEKSVETEFDGFATAIQTQETEDDAVTTEHLKSLVDAAVVEHLKPVIADVELVKGHVDNHESAIEGILETVESNLAS